MKEVRNEVNDLLWLMSEDSDTVTKITVKAKRQIRRNGMSREDKVGFSALLFVLFGIWLTVALLARFAPDVFRAW